MPQIKSILRRFDLDGDAKISKSEFETAMKSSLTTYGANKKQARPKIGVRLQTC